MTDRSLARVRYLSELNSFNRHYTRALLDSLTSRLDRPVTLELAADSDDKTIARFLVGIRNRCDHYGAVYDSVLDYLLYFLLDEPNHDVEHPNWDKDYRGEPLEYMQLELFDRRATTNDELLSYFDEQQRDSILDWLATHSDPLPERVYSLRESTLRQRSERIH